MISLEDIIIPPDNPRFDFSKESLEELIESIKTDNMIQPITVRPKGDKFELVVGERRVRAAAYAGMTKVPAIIRDVSDEEASRLRLIENIQRQDLNVFEAVKGIKAHMQKFGLSLEQMASLLHKDVDTLKGWFRVAESTSPTIQKYSSTKFRRLSLMQLQLLAKYNDDTQERLAETIVDHELTTTETRIFLKLFDQNPDFRSLDRLARIAKGEYETITVSVPKEKAEEIKKAIEKEKEKLEKKREKVKEKLKKRLRKRERKKPEKPVAEGVSVTPPIETEALGKEWEEIQIPYQVRSRLDKEFGDLKTKVSLARIIAEQKLDEWEINYLMDVYRENPKLTAEELIKIVKEESAKRAEVSFMVIPIQWKLQEALGKYAETRGIDIKEAAAEWLMKKAEELGYCVSERC
jgi:ParB family chromosome partitioning protein